MTISVILRRAVAVERRSIHRSSFCGIYISVETAKSLLIADEPYLNRSIRSVLGTEANLIMRTLRESLLKRKTGEK